MRAGPLLVGILAGLVAAAAPPAPTGDPTIDAVLVGLVVAVVATVSSRAPWWVHVIAAGTAMAVAVDPLLIAVAAIGLAAALVGGAVRGAPPVLRVAAAGISLNVLARSDLGGFLGRPTIVAVAVGALLFIAGLKGRSRRARRWALAGVGALVLLAGASTAAFAAEAARSRGELSGGLRWAESAVTALESGDVEQAQADFASAAGVLATAHDRLTSPWTLGASLVPVVAQHRSAAVDMSEVGADGAATVADALAAMDLESLRVEDGRIDVDRLAALGDQLAEVRVALDEVAATARSSRSPWLAGRATYELDDFESSVAEHLPSVDTAIDALRVAPSMLGADGPRRYLVLFTTPSESRGLGGFVGSYAELLAEDGRLTLGPVGRAQDLDATIAASGARFQGPDEFLARYGRFGYDQDGEGLIGSAAFRNVAMTPNFPWVGEITADIYAQATGRHVDGVIAADPYVVTQLLSYTGPIELTSIGQQLDAGNAAAYLLRDQYVVGAADDDERADALAEAAAQAFGAVLGGTLPEPLTLARDFGPLVDERRLQLWSAHAEEEAVIGATALAGAMPELDGADGWAVTVSNAGGNKIDSFLGRRAGYQAQTDAATGVTTATMQVDLTNDAPAEGLPKYVIGNRIGKPEGTSSLYVSLYTALELDGLTVDGQPMGVEAGTERGWNVYSFFVDIPAGATARIDAELSGRVDDPERVVTWTQPMTNPLEPLA